MKRSNVPVSEETTQECCRCPFCDQSMEMPFPFCQACGAELRRCPICGQVLAQDVDTCTRCVEEA